MIKIVGFNHKTGSFTPKGENQERKYDNYQIVGQDEKGEWQFISPVKKSVIDKCGFIDDNAMIGQWVDFYYDQYRKVSHMIVSGV